MRTKIEVSRGLRLRIRCLRPRVQGLKCHMGDSGNRVSDSDSGFRVLRVTLGTLPGRSSPPRAALSCD